ncbi:MAG: PH domain-containing protein [Halobacteriota archaeon]
MTDAHITKDDPPRTDEWLGLAADETIRWRGHPRTMRIAPSVLFGLAATGLFFWLGVEIDYRLGIAAPLGVLFIAWVYVDLKRTVYVITSRAVWTHSGVLGRTVRRVSLRDVQNTGYEQSIRGSTFGYGTVSIEVAGGPDVRFVDVESPRTVVGLLERSDRRERSTLPGRLEQWTAIRAAIADVRRAIDA